MTKRLEDALKRLTPEQIEQITRYAEGLAPGLSQQRFLKLDWAGCIDSEHDNGLDAQRDAMKSLTSSIERNVEG